MKHIKGDLVVLPQALVIVDDDGLLAQCFDIRSCLEMSLALNEHDKLVAQRDKMKTRFSHLHAALVYVYRILQEKSGSEYGLNSFEVHRCLRKLDTALALVRGEGDE